MFIFDYKLVIKTCGRTTLLRCLSRLLKIAKTRAGLNGPIEYVFYSRKSFMFPDHQPFPHNDWNKEVDVLNHYFRTLNQKVDDDFICTLLSETVLTH